MYFFKQINYKKYIASLKYMKIYILFQKPMRLKFPFMPKAKRMASKVKYRKNNFKHTPSNLKNHLISNCCTSITHL